jgi:glycosyltransferase involved in cell wall biosynthesis
MRDAYAQSRIFIAPMRIGTGLQNKLLEAMSMRLPCITTTLANNSLNAEENKDILIGNNEQEIAQHIITLLTNKDKADTIAQNGYDFVRRVYDWREATKIMETEMKLKIK